MNTTWSLTLATIAKLPAAVEAVVKSIKTTYPKLNIPFHSRMRHFEIDGVNTVHQISRKTANAYRFRV